MFGLRDARHGLVFSDDLQAHLIELPKFTKKADELASDLDRWCYFLRHGAELDPDDLPASLNVPPIRRALEVLTVFTQDEREREAYEQQLKAHLDYITGMRDAEDRGIEKGAAIGEIRLCQRLLKLPQTPKEQLAAMSAEDLAALLERLSAQLPSNGA
jgi:predicted transposase/invertase (TIGR01784 family)